MQQEGSQWIHYLTQRQNIPHDLRGNYIKKFFPEQSDWWHWNTFLLRMKEVSECLVDDQKIQFPQKVGIHIQQSMNMEQILYWNPVTLYKSKDFKDGSLVFYFENYHKTSSDIYQQILESNWDIITNNSGKIIFTLGLSAGIIIIQKKHKFWGILTILAGYYFAKAEGEKNIEQQRKKYRKKGAKTVENLLQSINERLPISKERAQKIKYKCFIQFDKCKKNTSGYNKEYLRIKYKLKAWPMIFDYYYDFVL